MKRQLWVVEMVDPLLDAKENEYGGWLPLDGAYLTRREARNACRDYNFSIGANGRYRIRKYVPEAE